MENSKFETLNFPPYRRRPLPSQTFQSLIQIISIFDDDPQCSKPQPSNSNSDSGGPGSKTDGHFAHAKVVSNDLLCQNDSLVDENRGVSRMQEGNLDKTHREIVGPDHIFKDRNKELAHTDSSLLTSNLEQQSIVKRVSCNEQQIGLEKDGKSNPWPEEITGNMGKRREAEIREPKRNMVDYNSEIFTHGTNIRSTKLNGRSKIFHLLALVRSKWAQKNVPRTVPLPHHRCKPKKDAYIPREKRPAPQAKERRESKKMCASQDKFESIVPEKPMEPLKTEGYDCKLETLRKKNQGTGVRNSDNPEVCPENLPSAGVVTAETISQNKENASAEKQKPNMKLAEKNGRTAVKCPQLQPVVKQKPVAHCRHYLHGRCKEGALCKFSHDTIPLTKSKPCSHFARHSCMKGDQCPFDHDLSKYPCNNFQTKGCCSRGVDCLFSHTMQTSEGASSSAVKTTGTDLLALYLLDHSSSLKQFILNEKLDAKSSPLTLSPCTNTEPNSTLTPPKPSTGAPKGMSFLSHVKLLQDTGSIPKVDGIVKVGRHQLTPSSVTGQNNNENTKKIPSVAPRGINFLAFGKKPRVEVSNSSLPVKRNDDGIGEKADSCLNKDDGDKVKSQSRRRSNTHVDFRSNNAAPVSLKGKDSVDRKPDLLTSQKPSFVKMILTNTPMSLQNVVKSTLAFASRYEFDIKKSQFSGSSTKALSDLDFL